MKRIDIINTVGNEYLTSNIENGEYSYVKAAGSKSNLERLLGHSYETHFELDIRFEDKQSGTVILIETKQDFSLDDIIQLETYLEEEKAVNRSNKIIAILANTNDDKIMVWKSEIDDEHLLFDELVLENMEYYKKLFITNKTNDREKVLKNTYALNETLHKKDIDEKIRSQFVGTILLHIKELVKRFSITKINNSAVTTINGYLTMIDENGIRAEICTTLDKLLDGTDNKNRKIELLQNNILNNQKVKKLSKKDWIEVFDIILMDIYAYIQEDSSEGQDILNLFFIAFNKYTGKADKNQAFTPDHITDFMCRITDVNWKTKVLDPTCGSGSFLVQAMVKELSDARKGVNEETAKNRMDIIKKQHIFGIEVEETAYGLATTNMLIHSDGNSNIKLGSCFDLKEFIIEADPDVILMNPPYNSKPKSIPEKYKVNWGKAANGKDDPTGGLVFLHYLSDILSEINKKRDKENKPRKTIKLASLLPFSSAIGGNSKIIISEKKALLKENTLEAVFSLPADLFHPGANVNACCMLFTFGQSHYKADGTPRSTFFGYCRDDGFVKKKNLGRVEQFNNEGISKWKVLEKEWIELFDNKQTVDGKSVVKKVTHNDEWLSEAYMQTSYEKLNVYDFRKVVNNYLAFLINKGCSDKAAKFMKHYNVVAEDSLDLKINQWEYFTIGDIFRIEPTKGKTTDELEEGNDIPYIAAKHDENGLMQMCKREGFEDWISQGNCIVFVQLGAGSAGYTNYIDDDFIGMNGKTSCGYIPDVMTPNIGLFLETVLCCERPKYSFGRSWTGDRLTDTIIKLPIKRDENNCPIIDEKKKYSKKGYIPDWDFMEEYINKLSFK